MDLEKQVDLLDECHRLRHLVEEMTDFKRSKEHQEMMDELKAIGESFKS